MQSSGANKAFGNPNRAFGNRTDHSHHWLIDQDMRVKLHEPVQPRGIVLRYIHAAMRTMDGELRAARVEVREVCTGAVLTAPPTVVQEVTVAMELHRIV